MGRTKKEKFSAAQNAFGAYNNCLSSPARVAILEFLLSRRRSTALQVIEAIDLNQVTVRKHLEHLVNSGFAKMQMQSGAILYSADREGFEKWYEIVGTLRSRFLGPEEQVSGQSISSPGRSMNSSKNWPDAIQEYLSQEEVEQFGLGEINRE